MSCVEHFVLFNAEPGTESSLPNVLRYEELMADADERFAPRCTDERMPMGLCYTSGTTGDPKGVLYSHRSMVLHTLGENQAAALAFEESDVVLPVVPQFHAMAWGLPYACASVGAELVMPGPFLKPEHLAEMIEEHRVTVAAGVPSIWNGLYHELQARPRDLSRVRRLIAGGSAMPRALIEGLREGARRHGVPGLGHDRDVAPRHRLEAPRASRGPAGPRALGRQGPPGLPDLRHRDPHRQRGR